MRLDIDKNTELELIQSSFHDVLQHRQYVLGPEVEQLEEMLALWMGTRYAIGCNSGFGAHLLSLIALELGPGAKVAVPAFAPYPYVGVLMRRGAIPILIDITPNDFHLNPAALAEVNGTIDAVIVHHLFGGKTQVEAIMKAAGQSPVIEVATYSLGACPVKDGSNVCGTLITSCLREPSTIGAYGDAGMIWTNDFGLWEKIRHIRAELSPSDVYEGYASGNFHQDTIQAAILVRKFRMWLESYIDYAKRSSTFAQELRERRLPEIVVPDFYNNNSTYFVILAERRDSLVEHLQAHGFSAKAWWPIPIHLQPGFQSLRYKRGRFPEAERIAEMSTHITLPESDNAIDQIVDEIATFYGAL